MDTILQRLKEAGLSGNEAKVYCSLLKVSSSDASSLAKSLGIDRTLVYQVLQNLIEKGMVNYITKESKRYFQPADPNNLLNPLKKKEQLITELIPDLQSLTKTDVSTQEVTVHEGKKGLRTIVTLALTQKEFFLFGCAGKAFSALYELPRIANEIALAGLSVRIIGDIQMQKSPLRKISKFKFRFSDFTSDATTAIFGDYVAIYTVEEKPYVILIKNALIAASYRNHFEVLWNISGK